MTEPDDDARWREIVENYGERARLADDDRFVVEDPEPMATLDAFGSEEPDEAERFVPPPPPAVPRPATARLLAWVGLLGVPLLLLVQVALSLTVPRLVSLACVGWFAAGFGYLVIAMPRGPRDPGDDGARL